MKLLVAITGASGSVYGQALLDRLAALTDPSIEVSVIFTENGAKVYAFELGHPPVVPPSFRVFDNQDLFADPASGTAGYTHMIICPCSMASLAKIAHGLSTDLVSRAADVMLKERRRLILVPREMPYSLVHLRNMETVTLAGGIICPASPSFYSLPKNPGEIVGTVVEKLLSLCGINDGFYRWGAETD